MRRLFIACLCAALPFAVQAQTYKAINELFVVPLGQTEFEVIEDHGEGARGVWCAAASYARDVLGVPGTQRIYIKTPRGPSVSRVGRTGVVFTTKSDAPDRKSYTVTVRRAGENLPVAHATIFCRDFVIDLRDL